MCWILPGLEKVGRGKDYPGYASPYARWIISDARVMNPGRVDVIWIDNMFGRCWLFSDEAA